MSSGQRDMTKLSVSFCNFANMPKNEYGYVSLWEAEVLLTCWSNLLYFNLEWRQQCCGISWLCKHNPTSAPRWKKGSLRMWAGQPTVTWWPEPLVPTCKLSIILSAFISFTSTVCLFLSQFSAFVHFVLSFLPYGKIKKKLNF
jgi:hypothetical protein